MRTFLHAVVATLLFCTFEIFTLAVLADWPIFTGWAALLTTGVAAFVVALYITRKDVGL